MSLERESGPVRGTEFSHLLTIRGEIHEADPFSEDDVVSGRKIIRPYAERTPRDLKTNPLVSQELARIKGTFEDQGLRVSTPRLTAMFIGDTVEKTVQELATSGPGTLQLCAMIDFAAGCFVVTNSIVLTEAALRGTLAAGLSEAVDYLGLKAVSRDKQNQAVGNLAQHEDLLIKDPTGKRLIDAAIEGLEKDPDFGVRFITKELAIEGARFVKRAYNAVSPIAERVNRAVV